MIASSEVEAVLREIDGEIADAEQRLADLRLQRRGAEAFIARLRPSTREDKPAPRAINRHAAVGHTDAVANVLADAPKPLDLTAIQAAVAQQGHPMDGEQIRSAVTYLRRKGQAENVGRGVWRWLASATDSVGLTDSVRAIVTPTDAESPEAPGLSVPSTSPREGVSETG